jgi:ABC-type lipoprotein release transport system permease subunit
MLLKMAIRNLWRNKRRTLITSAAVALGLAMLIFSSGFADGAHGQMIEAGVQSMAGHVVIQGEGYQKKQQSDIVVPDSPAVARRLAQVLPDARIVQRVFLQGLLTSPSGSVGVGISAVEPVVEAEVNDIDDKLVQGEYLADDDAKAIILGKALAKTLDVGLGDKVVLMTQHAGEIESQLFRVRGVFEVGIDEIDGFYAQIPLSAAQELLGLGHDVTQVSAHIDSYRDTRAATAQVRQAMGDVQGIEVLTWFQAMPDLYEWVLLDEGGMYVMLLIVVIVVALGIVNTVLMSVLERLREFGVMLSLGATPRKLSALVMTEAAALGLFATLLGLALGVAFNASWAGSGLDMTQMAGAESMEAAGVAFDMHIYPDLSAIKTSVFCALAFLMTVLAAIYPAIKAATLKPIECLQHR